MNVVSSTKITCSFNLAGKALGQWNVVVTNPDAQSGMLANGFTITDPLAPVINWVAVSPPMAAAGDAVHAAVDVTDNVGVTSAAAGNFLFATWGCVNRIDADTFELDDGSKTPVPVTASGHGLQTGDYAIARGIWSTSAIPHTLNCSAIHVTKVN